MCVRAYVRVCALCGTAFLLFDACTEESLLMSVLSTHCPSKSFCLLCFVRHGMTRAVGFCFQQYSNGETENILGRVLPTIAGAEKAEIATKAAPWSKLITGAGGVHGASGGAGGLAPDLLRLQLETSLKRLNVPKVQLFYLHAPDVDTPLEATLLTVSLGVCLGACFLPCREMDSPTICCCVGLAYACRQCVRACVCVLLLACNVQCQLRYVVGWVVVCSLLVSFAHTQSVGWHSVVIHNRLTG